jgi:hypothetical protein
LFSLWKVVGAGLCAVASPTERTIGRINLIQKRKTMTDSEAECEYRPVHNVLAEAAPPK